MILGQLLISSPAPARDFCYIVGFKLQRPHHVYLPVNLYWSDKLWRWITVLGGRSIIQLELLYCQSLLMSKFRVHFFVNKLFACMRTPQPFPCGMLNSFYMKYLATQGQFHRIAIQVYAPGSWEGLKNNWPWWAGVMIMLALWATCVGKMCTVCMAI